jgi:hypothetical protein
MNQADWLELGIASGYCTEPACATHDGTPMIASEEADFDEDGWDDRCVPIVRLLEAS